jgi:NodT family efflux transporter outer membrane factor (OMF) lipoprotein
LDLELSWEIDLWGRIRSLVRAEDEELAAAALDYEALRLSLSSQVAFAYYEAVEQRLQLELLEEQLKLANTFLELLELRFVQGDASAVDLLQQRSQVAEIQSEVPVAQSQLRLLENRLDVLLGVPPDGQDRTIIAGLPQATVLPDVKVPAALLRDRPDLQAAQRRVVAQDYRIASAMAERLPQLILDGTFGLSDSSDSSLLTGTGALGLFQPLLDWGRREAQVTVEKARFQDALLDYSQRYLVAIEEVETTLWQEARQRELIASLAEREQLLTRTVEETRVRYSLGVTDYLPVITALQDLQQVQRELLEQRRELVSLRIQLFRATGGATGNESA